VRSIWRSASPEASVFGDHSSRYLGSCDQGRARPWGPSRFSPIENYSRIACHTSAITVATGIFAAM